MSDRDRYRPVPQGRLSRLAALGQIAGGEGFDWHYASDADQLSHYARLRQQAHDAQVKQFSGGGAVEPVARDKDIFGDGRVVMLDMPGHTPGHHTLLVRLAGMGPVLLTGDLALLHFYGHGLQIADDDGDEE